MPPPHRLAPLPIDPFLPGLASALAGHGAAVLRAPTGSGKTTRVPPGLLDAGAANGGGRVVVLEPRRLAARAAARRIAEERGWEPGGRVGWHVRFDRRAGPGTEVLFVTEGMMVRMLQADPFLEGVGLVVFDEFHERSLDADLALGMVSRLRREARPDLRVVVMSATLDPAPVAAYLVGCPVVEAPGRLHPVEVRYAGTPLPRDPRALSRELPGAVASAVRGLLPATGGDLLVFLPGVGEIRACEEALAGLARQRDLALLRLHGRLPLEEQDAALRPLDGQSPRRKVILATNVAESSVTVEGVTAVVDSGLARQLRHDLASGLNRLELVRISRASADQRAGRAGRTEPGVCLRLWPEIEHPALPERDLPEVARLELSGAALELLAWGETDLDAFPWFEAPPPAALDAARTLLRRLGALSRTPGAGLTPLGRTLARLPVHPRLGRLLVEGQRRGRGREAALLAAMLSERPPFLPSREGPPEGPAHASRSDLLDRLDALERFERTGHDWSGIAGRVNRSAARFVLQSRDQLAGLVESELGTGPAAPPEARDEALLRALFAAHPDRLVRRREPGSRQGVMVGGRGVVLARESAVVEPELLVAVDLDAGRPGERSEALVRLASVVERAWLPEELVTEEDEVAFDPTRERVAAWRVTRYEDLEIERREMPANPEAAGRVLAEAALARPERALALDDPETASLLERLRFLRRWLPELKLPDPEDSLRELLPGLAAGKRSFDELRRLPLVPILRGTLTHPQREALARDAPERLEVPSGSRVRLDYRGDEPPVLPVRIQEVFGWRATPRVAGGRVPVLLHLLAPNRRPQQVTDDLESFWANTYPQVRKELAGRYPKHAWPADPLAAAPERRPGRKS
ncbi:MAG TPA: ATP-dependent helicase HrpB [Thermoanaerobaculia bacterium]|nr:ATP-dependent helicase HrpB [Thermoanaerobaculia bacterium]